jgi:hypothetical protein
MIHWTADDTQFLDHMTDVMGDRLCSESGYTEQDEATMTKLKELAKAGAAVTVTSEQQDYRAELGLFLQIVQAELDHWVPNASQRLLFRAGAALGVKQPDPARVRADCGSGRADHATVPDWVSTLYVHRCINCARLFRA